MKKKHVVLVAVLLVVTNFFTFTMTNRVNAVSGMNLKQMLKLQLVEDFIEKNYLRDVDKDKFFEGQLKGVVRSLDDPYSEYLTAKEMLALSEETSGHFYGVGIMVSPGKDNLITVISPIKGSPADKAGIKAGDRIIKVDGKEFTGENLSEAVDAMKGERGTKVTLHILTEVDGKPEIREVTIVRDEITVETVLPGRIGEFGYLGITQFNENTGEEFTRELDKLTKEGIKGLILDLRGNPGGVVDAAAVVADALLPEGTIVTSKNRAGELEDHYTSDEKHLEVPMVVLINGGSASASEIVAGAIKDYHAGKLIGETTFGKGVIQVVRPFKEGDGIKLTVAEYFTPSGVNIHGIGIKPDMEVKLDPKVKGIGLEHQKEDNQLQKALEVLKNETREK